MSLYLTMVVNDEPIGSVTITRGHDDNTAEVDAVNVYQWRYSREGKSEAAGHIFHRYGDGAVALAHAVLGEITERQRRAAGLGVVLMTNNPDLDAVAKAMFESTERAFPDAFPWEKMTAPEQSDWLRMAAAAVDALNLTEEWGVERGQGLFAYISGTRYPDRDSAAAAAKRIDKRFWNSMESVAGAGIAAPNAHPVSRLVSPWLVSGEVGAVPGEDTNHE